MPQANWQKLKMLKLVELLRSETDEDHPMGTNTICARLESMDIPCDRRTLSKDIALLNDQGIEVMWTWVGKEKGYYIVDRSFSIPEIKILIDAVQAASFITDRKTEELIDKLAALGGSHKAEILKNNIVHFNTRKHSNESIFYNVDTLELALQSRKKVIFKYFDLDADCKAVYRRDGHHYVVEPVALVFNEDNYYLVCYSSRYEDTANYRVDRMADVTMIDENISEKAIELKETVGEYTGQALKMFSGQLENVVLEFDKKLIGAVYDRFGEEIIITGSGDNECAATVAIQISPTFWGWIFQFGKDMKILSPESLAEEYRHRVESLLE